MKKILIISLLIVLVLPLLVACGVPVAPQGAEAAAEREQLDVATLIAAVVNSGTLFVIIGGLVELSRRLGATGKLLLVESVLLGLVLGFGYLFSIFGVPRDLADWFAMGVAGIFYGLATSGIVDLTGRLASGDSS